MTCNEAWYTIAYQVYISANEIYMFEGQNFASRIINPENRLVVKFSGLQALIKGYAPF